MQVEQHVQRLSCKHCWHILEKKRPMWLEHRKRGVQRASGGLSLVEFQLPVLTSGGLGRQSQVWNFLPVEASAVVEEPLD